MTDSTRQQPAEHEKTSANGTDSFGRMIAALTVLGSVWPPGATPENAEGFIPPCDPAAAAQELANQFPLDDLIAAGVCIETTEGQLTLSPALTAAAGPLICLRVAEHASTWVVLGGHGHLPPQAWAAAAVLLDPVTGRLMAGMGGDLFLVPPRAVAAYRGYKLPAAPWTAPAEERAQLCEILANALKLAGQQQGRRIRPNKGDNLDPIRRDIEDAIISAAVKGHAERQAQMQELSAAVGTVDPLQPALIISPYCPPHSVEKSTSLEEAAKFYADLVDARPELGIRCGVWLPTEADLAGFARSFEFGDRMGMRLAIARSVAAHLYTPAAALEQDFQPRAEAQTILEAESDVREAEQFFGPRGGPEVDRRRRRHLELLEQHARGARPDEAAGDLEAALQTVVSDAALALRARSPRYRAETLAALQHPTRDRADLEALHKDLDRELKRLVQAAGALAKIPPSFRPFNPR